MNRANLGQAAPDFTRTAQSGETIRLSDYRGRNVVVLFFYPKDGSAICTREACSFRDSYEDFVKAGAVVVGVSGDTEDSHRDFARQHSLPFVLLADVDGSLRRLFGVPKTLGFLPGRVTYVIDRSGIVRLVFNSQLSAAGHVDEALRMVRELQQQPSPAATPPVDKAESR